MTEYKYDHGKKPDDHGKKFDHDIFKFYGGDVDQENDQANDASIDQEQDQAAATQENNVEQTLNQANVQSSEQNTVVSVDDSGNGGGGAAGGAGGGGGDGADGDGGGGGIDLEALQAILDEDLPPGITRQLIEDLIAAGGGDGDGGAGGDAGDGGDGGDGGDVTVVTANENDQDAFNIGANVSFLDQDQEDIEVDQEQEQDAAIGQLNLAGLDAFA